MQFVSVSICTRSTSLTDASPNYVLHFAVNALMHLSGITSSNLQNISLGPVDIAKAELHPGEENIWACPVTNQQVPMKRCIDDTLTWAGSFENAARQIWAILYWGAESGVVFNLDKLIIGKPDIQIFGYNIDKTGIHPTEEMKDAI